MVRLVARKSVSTRKKPYQPAPQPIYRQVKVKKVRKKSHGSGVIRWIGAVLSLIGVAMISAMAGALLAFSFNSTPLMQRPLSAAEQRVFGQDTISTQGVFQLPKLTRPVNILVLGVKVLTTDLKEPPANAPVGYHALVNSLEGLTDTMMLIRFNPATQQLVVLSLPRDTQVPIEGYGTEKLNAANYYGGPALAAKTVSQLLGSTPIDRYIRINVQGVEKLIDALGGVTVYVPQDMKYQDDSQHLYINLKAGKQHLNGDKTLQLLRFRYDENGDIGRIQRQQMVIRAMKEQALNPVTIARLPQILKVVQSHIDTNLSVEELMALVGFGANINKANTQMLMVPGDFSLPGEYRASYWLPNYKQIDQMVARHFGQGTVTRSLIEPALLRISIQDSTGKPDAVTSLVKALQQSGYTNVYVDKPWTEPLITTRLIAQSGDSESAQAVRDSLKLGEVQTESTGTLQSDVTIQLGKDWLTK